MKFLFDYDGVIVDSETLSKEAYVAIATNRGIPFNTILKIWNSCLGLSASDEAIVFQSYGIDFNSFHKEVTAYIANYYNRPPLIPHVDYCLQELYNRGIASIIVTSNTRDTVISTLDYYGLTHLVSNIIAAEDTACHKPDPEPYLLAAEGEEAVAVDDSLNGIRAALAAQIPVVAFADYASIPLFLREQILFATTDMRHVIGGVDKWKL